MSIVLDLIIVAIIGLGIFFSAKHGFVRTIIEVVGFIAAFLIAFSVSTPLAQLTYDKTIRPAIVSSMDSDQQLDDNATADKIWDALPDIAKNYAERLGLSRETLRAAVADGSGNTSEIVENVADKTIGPTVVKILGIIYSTVIVIVLLILSKLLAKLINKLIDFSVVGKINTVLGGVVGVFKGAAFAVIVCMVISVLVVISGNGFGIFTEENINSTVLFKSFYGISPFI